MRADFESYLNWEGVDALARLLDAADEAQIRYVVVMPKTEVEPQNDRLARDIASNPRLLGCGLINPHHATAVEEVRHLVNDCGFKGVKLMGAIHKYEVDNEPLVRPIVEAAAELRIVVSVHSGPRECHPDRIGAIAGWIPDTPIVMDHMGFPDHLADTASRRENTDPLLFNDKSVQWYWDNYLTDPADVRLISEDEDATIPAIRQAYVMVEPGRKMDLLVKLLEREHGLVLRHGREDGGGA